ncbi:MAG: PTS system mannose/fructose/sorbose family transporter subunit IID, partial [Gemmatimonadetes bacterium]|nr:PTS system mannose/fructose/sorbose family transporter subunit IID [Gemmatimonadota bacterium]
MRLLRSDHLAAWSRTFAIQGSWNYSTMVGAGIAYAVLPLLRRIHAGDPVRLRESVERSMRPFNG